MKKKVFMTAGIKEFRESAADPHSCTAYAFDRYTGIFLHGALIIYTFTQAMSSRRIYKLLSYILIFFSESDREFLS